MLRGSAGGRFGVRICPSGRETVRALESDGESLGRESLPPIAKAIFQVGEKSRLLRLLFFLITLYPLPDKAFSGLGQSFFQVI